MECTLKEWSMEYAEDIAAAVNNPKILNNLRDGLPYPYTVEDAREFIQSMIDAPKDMVYPWAIICEGKAIGSIGVFRGQNIHSRTAEMGYYIAEPYWGRGLMAQAVVQACEQIFDKTDIIRIYAEPFAQNTASCRVLEKAGFIYEGTLHKNAVKNGKIIDMKLYVKVKG